ncbi:MAG: disulfide bond formation protein B [Alphaproteobacteria bacterium]|nr:disulfide bond formation protein B [Alphaproteobacteria bacterium]
MNFVALFHPRCVFILSLLVAIAALGAALVAQFVFDLKPCILCLYSRIPYALLIPLSLVALLYPEKNHRLFLILIMVLFFASFCIAFFHIGVEQHWWQLSGGCPVEALDTTKTSEQMLAELLATPLAPCDKVAWRLFGISIVIWNAALALAMHDYVLIAFVLHARKARARL